MRTLNSGILAHVDAGRTSLAERLHAAGVIDEVGGVDDGSTPTDSLALERRRGITFTAAVVSFDVGGMTVNLIDTPGHPDFIAEVERALGVHGVLGGAVLAEHDATVLACVEGWVVPDSCAVVAAHAHRCAVHPVYFGSAIKGAGVPELVAESAEFLPPASRDPTGWGRRWSSSVNAYGTFARSMSSTAGDFRSLTPLRWRVTVLEGEIPAASTHRFQRMGRSRTHAPVRGAAPVWPRTDQNPLTARNTCCARRSGPTDPDAADQLTHGSELCPAMT